MCEAVRDTIEKLYSAFSDCPKPLRIEGCPCCIDGKEGDILLSKPIRDITAEEISGYAASVFLTVGNVDDFSYFVPRILEVSFTEDTWYPDPEIVLGKLPLAHWHEWPEEQRSAIVNYIDAVIQWKIQNDEAGSELDTWLCAAAHCLEDISPYLEKIKNNRRALLAFHAWQTPSLIRGRLADAFWQDIPETARIVFDWFNSVDVQALIEQGYKKPYQ